MAIARHVRDGGDAAEFSGAPIDNQEQQRRTRADTVQAVEASSGTPLAESIAARLEPRLDTDLSDVRVHTDTRAEHAASSLAARAFTVGRSIYFAAGEFRPGTSEGDRLLAHELTHVAQQRKAPIDVGVVEPHDSTAEREAHAAATEVTAGRKAKPPSAAPRGIPRDAGWARRGEIPDPYGEGYNTILASAGPEAKGAVLALASLETPNMFVDIEAYKKLDTPVRKSILALERHAAGTACAGWFDVMRANDPELKPKLSPAEIAAGEAAFYGAEREVATRHKVDEAKAALADATPVDIDKTWDSNKYGLITSAQTPNHGIKADALHAIWVKYWADKIAIAESTISAIQQTEIDKHEDLSESSTFKQAKATKGLGDFMMSHSVLAIEICRAADADGRSLTLDELNQRVIDAGKVWDLWAEAISLFAVWKATSGGGGGGGYKSEKPERNPDFGTGAGKKPPIKTEPIKVEPIKTEPIKTEPIKTEPIKTEPIKVEPVKVEPVKVEPVKVEPVKVEPVKVEPVKVEPVKVEAAKPAFPANEFPESDATWKQWPPPKPVGPKPDWNKPGGARYRYDRYRYEKWEESGKPSTPPKEPLLPPDKYYDRYVAPKAAGQSPGEMGSPEHKALVVGVRDANAIGTQTMGEQRPDAVGKIDQPIKIPDGPTVTPQKGARVLYEADNFYKDGSQIVSEGREQVRQFRKDNPDATIVVQDTANPKNIIIYEPGTQPPPGGRLPPGTPNKVPVK